METVNHPAHYNIPGRKECIVEMLEKFGRKKVKAFCELNAYKYQYRHEMKNGEEDLKKACWYIEKLNELDQTDPEWIIANEYGIVGMTIQCIEEMSELVKAFTKIFRLRGTGAPLAPDLDTRTLLDNRIEEIADVKITLDELIYLLDCEEKVKEITEYKLNRTLERMDEKDV